MKFDDDAIKHSNDPLEGPGATMPEELGLGDEEESELGMATGDEDSGENWE